MCFVGSFQTCFDDPDRPISVVGKPGPEFNDEETCSFRDWMDAMQAKRILKPRLHPEEHRCVFLEFLIHHKWIGPVDHEEETTERPQVDGFLPSPEQAVEGDGGVASGVASRVASGMQNDVPGDVPGDVLVMC